MRKRKIIFNLLSLFSFLCYFILNWILLFSLFGTFYLLNLYFKEDTFGGKVLLFYIISLLTANLVLIYIQKKMNLLERLDRKAKSFKDFYYTKKYGKKFKKPKISDFNITSNEFKIYNNRFQLSFSAFITLFSIICFVFYKFEFGNKEKVVIIFIAILIYYLTKYIDKRISLKHKYYKKINDFQKKIKIYYKIQEENNYNTD